MKEEGFNYKMAFGMLLGVAVLLVVVAMVFQALDVGMTNVETFAVTDPTVDQHLNLTSDPDESSIVVEQYTGVGWETIGATDLTIDSEYIIVDADALYG